MSTLGRPATPGVVSFTKTTSLLGVRFWDGGYEGQHLVDVKGRAFASVQIDDALLPCEAWPGKDLSSSMDGPKGHFEITVVFTPETPLPPEEEAYEGWHDY